ncbi:MAG: tetratricopeptide repeat protein [Phycisphaerae bacterium]
MPSSSQNAPDRPKLDATPPGESTPGSLLAAIIGIITLTVVAYYPSLTHEFVSLDDYEYVIDNTLVRNPSGSSARRFLTEVTHPSTVSGYYQPLTMLSLMLDAAIAGDNGCDSFVYHATNILLHTVNAVLVLLILRGIFGGLSIPIIGALFFAIHPAQVESVAWISQRKTVLATLFALASVAVYLQYGRRGGRGRLAAAFCLYVLGTLAKPTIVPLALVYPLLDYWPLNRRFRKARIEKIPFVVVMIIMGTIAWISQANSGASLSLPNLAGLNRAALWAGLVSYNFVLYLGNIFWPMSLSPYRAMPDDLSIGNPVLISSVLGVTAFVMLILKARRWSKPMFVGTAAFVILLLPALGGIRFTATCVADRFLYLPLALLMLPLSALLQSIKTHMQRARVMQICIALLSVPLFILCRAQQTIWRDSRSLWTHIHNAAPTLPMANYHLGSFLIDEGAFAEARACAERAVRFVPDNPHYQLMYGRALTRTGSPAEAVTAIRKAIDLGLGRKQSWGYSSLAEALIVLGDADQAQEVVRKAAKLGRDDATSLAMIARVALDQAHNCTLAIGYYHEALERDEGSLSIRHELAQALEACGKHAAALAEYEKIITRARQAGMRFPKVEAEAAALRRKPSEPRP